MVTLFGAATAKPTFTAPQVDSAGETLTFKLTVTSEDTLESTDTVDITVAKIQPLADAGPDQTVNESVIVTLDASGSLGVELSYQWTQTAGNPQVDLSDETAEKPTFTAPLVDSAGETLTFQLTVTDDDDDDSTAMVNITVKTLPEAVAGQDQDVKEGDLVTLDGSKSIGSDGMISYLWEQEPGGTRVPLTNAATATATFTAPTVDSAGETLTFELTVTDNDGLSSSDTVRVTVNEEGGGGGGGGGCFIAAAANGSPMALHGKVLRALSSQFAGVNWKRLMAGEISLLTPRAEHAATPALMIAMVVLINTWVALVLRTRHKSIDKTILSRMSQFGP